ncbi:MAG TPA: cytochrome P450 [Streptosporangiaceae bacterium]|nr:cytochrome P450 [Streptosporangiaceae bacterium]
MKITAPPAGARTNLEILDLADPELYVSGDAHLAWQTLRAEQPVFWQRQESRPGFWAVTRYQDVRRVLRDHETFTSECGTAISMLGTVDAAAGKMMQATDPPRHKQFRDQLGRPLAPHAVSDHAGDIRLFVRQAIAPARDLDNWDAAAAFTRVPMQVAALFMGLPEADVDQLLRLSFAALAPLDPHYRLGSEKVTLRHSHHQIINYFDRRLRELQANPGHCLISHLIGIKIDGQPLTQEELLLNCLSMTLGAVVTTSQAVSATMIALAEQGCGEGHWSPDTPVPAAVEEALRWSSPTTHFMRRARRDVELHGVTIRTGEPVTSWIASANRDESVFDQACVLDLARAPNRHLSFGSGPHRCIGSPTARLVLRTVFEELFANVECFELTGPAEHLVSNEIAGVVSLPVRVRVRPGARLGGLWA